VLVAAPPALGAFPGTNPAESVRVNTPNDPDFDRCEPDDEQGVSCTNTFGQQIERFGFAPNGSQLSALYLNPTAPHTQRLAAQNTAAGRNPLGQVSGVSADRAWKYSIGTPSVQVAILDTGIRWNSGSLRKKVALNRGELPLPQNGASTCAQYDCNSDGAFNVDDYANDPRVAATTGNVDEPGADSFLDGSDLIAAFSDSGDDDGNGHEDDIAGWDFFDDDNNPYDASSYSSASNHGTGRAEEAGEQTNEGAGGAGVCPECQVVPLRVWDTFVVDTNNFAQAVLYAADNDVEVVEGAVGALFNSRFARQAFEHAYKEGVFFTIVSSDLNTADHNVPTVYDEAMQVQGTVADVHGLGENPPQEFMDFFNDLGVPLGTNAPIGTWFRNSGTTQYGGHAHIVMPAVTGSAATGQASGAAGLIKSYAREEGLELEPNEVKQLITGTAEDVVQENTAGLGVPDPAQPGWDQHFGYGRPDLGLALQRIDENKIPPQSLITSPEWFEPLNVNQQEIVDIRARVSAKRAAGYTYRLQWAPGIEPQESAFQDVNVQTRTTPLDGSVGVIDLNAVRDELDSLPQGGATVDPTAPAKGPGDKDPNEPAFTVRVVVTDTAGNRAEDRKMLFAYRDATLHQGYSKDLGTGGEASPRLFDLNGDNALDTVLADSSGELRVLNHDGQPLTSFNNGQPVRAALYPNVHLGSPSYNAVDPPREVLRTPAIGDVDGDLLPEIVVSGGEHVYAWNDDGSAVDGFPVRLDPALSRPQDRNRNNHIKRGFSASAALGDLDDDGRLDIVIPALDQHVYAWDGDGDALPGFPKKLQSPGIPGAEIITTAALGDVSGDGEIDIVTPTQEFDDNPSAPQTPGGGVAGGFSNILTNLLANVLGGSGRVYALDRDGNELPGWPTAPNGIVPDALPFVGPGVDHILANVDGDPELEAIGNVASGEVTATNGDGSNAAQYDSEPAGGEHVDKSKVINLFENPIAANIDGVAGPEIIKGGVTLNQVVNLGVAVGQNLPYNHVVQAWNAQTGASLPTFPQAVEDFQLLSSPGGRGRLRLARQRGGRRHRPVLPAQLQRGRHRGRRLAQVHRRLDLRDPVDRRRGRRRPARGHHAHARRLRVHVGHGPARVRHERRVVDVAPRRVEQRRLRHRLTAARNADGPALQPHRTACRDARVDRARRRLALRTGQHLPHHRLRGPDRAAHRRHGDRRLPGHRVRGPDPEQVGQQHEQPVPLLRRHVPRQRGQLGSPHERIALLPAAQDRHPGADAAGARLPGVHVAEPGARAAPRRPVVRAPGAAVEHADRRLARLERVPGELGGVRAAEDAPRQPGHPGGRGRRGRVDRHHRRALRADQRGLHLRCGVRLHREAAGHVGAPHHRQVQRLVPDAGRHRGRYEDGGAVHVRDDRRRDDRRALHGHHDHGLAAPRGGGRGQTGGVADRGDHRRGRRAERDRLRRGLPDDLR
jgi:hypothetical protein